MRDLAKMRERFLRDGRDVRLGNIASDMLRLSSWVRAGRSGAAVVDLIREIAWLMEWSGDLAVPDLADMQRELCRWRRMSPLGGAGSVLELRARQMSDRLLEIAGLVQPVA